MHRFFVPPEACHGPEVNLPAQEAHHAVNVLRVRDGERVVILNGIGEELLCEVLEAAPEAVRVRIVQRIFASPLPCRVTLLQAVAKPKAMDFVVQKATELGAARIVPILSERTVAHWDPETAALKAARWRAAAIDAAKQCGSPWLPTIETPVTVAAFLARQDRAELVLIASLQAEARHPREHFRAFAADRRGIPRSVAVWVGPEGDFTPAEINAARAAGALPISLGPLVLRSETAAFYCLAVISYEVQAAAG